VGEVTSGELNNVPQPEDGAKTLFWFVLLKEKIAKVPFPFLFIEIWVEI
jgi:hypothetical protein